ncbi:hypothetical protein [Neobacillus dielmonensis]|uniref:hypothetical protein n=1 Tax=Neobacillus dielmonensis TaxID=1347369 RepID=UPI00069424E0|nr:hypothetical protein [Neobacillus dielmonensis]
MYYSPFHYPEMAPVPPYGHSVFGWPAYRTYPPADISLFQSSIQSFHQLMEQGSLLLSRLANPQFARRLMNAAQQGKQNEVNQLMKSIGLHVPVLTKYTPSGVNFILTTKTGPGSPNDCCSLTISLKWGL